MSDDSPQNGSSKEPFTGNEPISKNLSTLPEGDTDRAGLLNQIMPDSDSIEPKPAQQDSGRNEPK